VDPDRFFRISRKYIICLEAIDDMLAFSNSRLRIVVKNYDDDQVIVARERVAEFKEWLDR
ncbi:MAG: LytTR family transcriptional regulator DNA-binding domain-containing protein, partial [Bacteroidota bacterium]